MSSNANAKSTLPSHAERLVAAWSSAPVKAARLGLILSTQLGGGREREKDSGALQIARKRFGCVVDVNLEARRKTPQICVVDSK